MGVIPGLSRPGGRGAPGCWEMRQKFPYGATKKALFVRTAIHASPYGAFEKSGIKTRSELDRGTLVRGPLRG